MYLIPKTIHKKMDCTRKRFFWQGGGMKKKYHLVKWCKIAKPKQKGGQGIHDLRKMNLSLLCKWWWKVEKGEGLWQEIVRKKYIKQNCSSHLKYKATNSPVWNDLLKVREYYLKGRVMVVGNGKITDFWLDPWCGAAALKDKFPDLYIICNEKFCSVASMAQRGWRLTFRRWLDEEKQNQLRRLQDITTSFALGRERDCPRWIWGKTGRFSVKSMYKHFFSEEANEPNKKIWKTKLPLKIKIFMWLIQQNSILTKDNLLKRGWNGDSKCMFCREDESIIHLFFECSMAKYVWSMVAMVVGGDCRPSSFDQFWYWVKNFMPRAEKFHMVGLAGICWALWRTRNNVCFEEKKVRSPTEVICLASSFISFWAELQSEEDKLLLEGGADILRAVALSLHPHEAPPGDAGVVLLQ